MLEVQYSTVQYHPDECLGGLNGVVGKRRKESSAEGVLILQLFCLLKLRRRFYGSLLLGEKKRRICVRDVYIVCFEYVRRFRCLYAAASGLDWIGLSRSKLFCTLCLIEERTAWRSCLLRGSLC